MKASELFTKVSSFGLTELADRLAGAALQHSPRLAILALQSALRVSETGEWDDETERAVLHQGQHSVVKFFKEELARLES